MVRWLDDGRALYPPFPDHPGPVAGLAVGNVGGRSLIVSGGRLGEIVVRDLVNGELLFAPVTISYSRILGIALVELDGRPMIVSCGFGVGGRQPSYIRVWSMEDGKLQYSIPLSENSRSRAFSVGTLDGQQTFAISTADGVEVGRLKTGATLHAIEIEAHVQSLAIVSGLGVAVGTSHGLLMLTDIRCDSDHQPNE